MATFRYLEELPPKLRDELEKVISDIAHSRWKQERYIEDPYTTCKYCVYIFLVSEKTSPSEIYVGQALDFYSRRTGHLSARDVSRDTPAFILASAETRREILRLEALWINAFRCFPNDFVLKNKMIPPLRTRQKNKNGRPIEFIAETMSLVA